MTRLNWTNCHKLATLLDNLFLKKTCTLWYNPNAILVYNLLQYSLFYWTTCQSRGSAYFDTFMQLHMTIIKNRSSPRINYILGTMKVSTRESTRPPSFKWAYIQLSSWTHLHSIIGNNPLALSTIHALYHHTLYPFLSLNQWHFVDPLDCFHASYCVLIHCALLQRSHEYISISMFPCEFYEDH